jgi:hypothetical protein
MNDDFERMWKEILLEGLKKTTRGISEDSRCLYRDSNQALPEYKSKALPPQPTTLGVLCIHGRKILKWYPSINRVR